VGGQKGAKKAIDLILGELVNPRRQLPYLFLGQIDQSGPFLRGLRKDFYNQEVTHEPSQFTAKFLEVVPEIINFIHNLEKTASISLGQGLDGFMENFSINNPQDFDDFVVRYPQSTKGENLVQEALSIPHGPLGFPGDQVKAWVADLHPFSRCNGFQMFQGGLQGNALEIIPLAAGKNRQRNLMGLGGGKNENYMGRRFLQGLQESIEGLGGKHVNFIDDIDLVFILSGEIFDVFS
jgi:hypothetical protein